MTAVLQTAQLSVRYGGVQALSAVDLTVEQGQMVGLIGPNGAGKTTFIDAVSGYVRAEGTVSLGGQDVSSLRPDTRVGHGLGRTWQAVELFDDLSVRENLVVSTGTRSFRRTLRQILTGRIQIDRRVDEALELLGIEHLAASRPEELTNGQRKLVGVARSLVASPRVICLDEPAAGLDVTESTELGRQLRSVVDRGTALLLVDHDMGLVLSVCDTVVVLEFGQVISVGAPEQVKRDSRVIAAYLGGGDPEDSATRAVRSDLATAATAADGTTPAGGLTGATDAKRQ